MKVHIHVILVESLAAGVAAMQQGSKFRWALRYSQPRIVTKPALWIRNAASAVAGVSSSDRSSAKPELGDVLQLHCSRLGFDGKVRQIQRMLLCSIEALTKIMWSRGPLSTRT